MKKILLNFIMFFVIPLNLMADRFEISHYTLDESMKKFHVAIIDTEFSTIHYYEIDSNDFHFKESTYLHLDVADIIFHYLPIFYENI